MNLIGKYPLVRLKQFRDNPRYFWYYLKRLFYYKFISHRYIPLCKDLTFLTPQETLEYLINNHASIARFGDGDIEQLIGAGTYPPDSDWSQRASNNLAQRLKEVLQSDIPNLLISPIAPSIFLCTKEEAKQRGVIYNMWTDARLLLHRYLKPGRMYGDANVFVPAHHPNFDWKKLYEYLKDRDVVVVTGGTSKLQDVSLGRHTFFVEAGKHDAFESYDEIYKNLMNLIEAEKLQKEKTLIMASLGPTADILALDLTKNGWQVWDTGHMFKFASKEIKQLSTR